MKKILILAALLSASLAYGQRTEGLDPLIQHVYGREIRSLNGYWNYFADPLETGYYDYRRRPDPNGFFKDKQVDNVTTWKEYDFARDGRSRRLEYAGVSALPLRRDGLAAP